jgi:hypothetical protein
VNEKRLTLFLKGNVDVHDSLHSCRLGGKLLWNGINEVLRSSHPGCLARIKHETWTRSDALLHSHGTVPQCVTERQLPLGSYPAESQFSHAVFDTRADAIVLSIQPDLTTGLVKHRRDGFLFYASERTHWTADDRQWLASEFRPEERLQPDESMANFTAIIERIRQRSQAPILIYNLSPIIPGEALHCHQGLDETYSTCIRKFNLGLIELSEKTGVSIVDIDSLLARKGADALKLDPVHLTSEGYRLVAAEVVRVLADLGVLESEPS